MNHSVSCVRTPVPSTGCKYGGRHALRAIVCTVLSLVVSASAGTWRDDFAAERMSPEWTGDIAAFRQTEGELVGVSAHPVLTVPAIIEVGSDRWREFTASVRVNVVKPNLAICSKGGIVVARTKGSAVVFAIHPPSKRVEVFELYSRELLLMRQSDLPYDRWHTLRIDMNATSATFYFDGSRVGSLQLRPSSGPVGLCVEDTMDTRFDEFSVRGSTVPDYNGFGTVDAGPDGKAAAMWGDLKARR